MVNTVNEGEGLIGVSLMMQHVQIRYYADVINTTYIDSTVNHTTIDTMFILETLNQENQHKFFIMSLA